MAYAIQSTGKSDLNSPRATRTSSKTAPSETPEGAAKPEEVKTERQKRLEEIELLKEKIASHETHARLYCRICDQDIEKLKQLLGEIPFEIKKINEKYMKQYRDDFKEGNPVIVPFTEETLSDLRQAFSGLPDHAFSPQLNDSRLLLEINFLDKQPVLNFVKKFYGDDYNSFSSKILKSKKSTEFFHFDHLDSTAILLLTLPAKPWSKENADYVPGTNFIEKDQWKNFFVHDSEAGTPIAESESDCDQSDVVTPLKERPEASNVVKNNSGFSDTPLNESNNELLKDIIPDKTEKFNIIPLVDEYNITRTPCGMATLHASGGVLNHPTNPSTPALHSPPEYNDERILLALSFSLADLNPTKNPQPE